MKKIAQLGALIVALLVVVQSALADSPCSKGLHSGCNQGYASCGLVSGSSGSPLTMSCHGSMRSDSTTSECNQGDCSVAAVRLSRRQSSRSNRGISAPPLWMWWHNYQSPLLQVIQRGFSKTSPRRAPPGTFYSKSSESIDLTASRKVKQSHGRT